MIRRIIVGRGICPHMICPPTWKKCGIVEGFRPKPRPRTASLVQAPLASLRPTSSSQVGLRSFDREGYFLKDFCGKKLLCNETRIFQYFDRFLSHFTSFDLLTDLP